MGNALWAVDLAAASLNRLALDVWSESIGRIPWLRSGIWAFLNFAAFGAGKLIGAKIRVPLASGTPFSFFFPVLLPAKDW